MYMQDNDFFLCNFEKIGANALSRIGFPNLYLYKIWLRAGVSKKAIAKAIVVKTKILITGKRDK